MSSQMGAMTFINEGSTRRKEILAKFLDLDQFEKKFRRSKDDSIETRALLKKLEDNNFDEEITQLHQELTDNEKGRTKQEKKCDTLTTKLDTINTRVKEIEDLFASAPVEIINIKKENKRLTEAQKEMSACHIQTAQAKRQKTDILGQAEILAKLLKRENIDDLRDQLTKCEELQEELRNDREPVNAGKQQQTNL